MSVVPGSPAGRAGVQPGDLLLQVDEHSVEDALDLPFYLRPETSRLNLRRNGALLSLRYDAAEGEDPGWQIEELKVRSCHCNCMFCFVQQLPAGLRSSLYVKDEDYRFSFLFGNYLTLLGMSSRDLERILHFKLSPLYVSIHATDPELRARLLGVKKAPILPVLGKLLAGGIEVHGQIVLVPGGNDGAVLEKTLKDLAPLFPGLASLSVVPVGLTQHRQDLESIRPLTLAEARQALSLVQSYQLQMLASCGSRWVFPADELLLLAGEPFPPANEYEDYPQLENGVGLVRWTMTQAKAALKHLPKSLPTPRRILWVTGISARETMCSIAASFNKRVQGLRIEVLPVANKLLGSSVTVAGLLGGKDICSALRKYFQHSPREKCEEIFLPPDCLNSAGLLLDDWTPADISREIALPVRAFSGDWAGMIRGIAHGRRP